MAFVPRAAGVRTGEKFDIFQSQVFNSFVPLHPFNYVQGSTLRDISENFLPKYNFLTLKVFYQHYLHL